jgi:penicillin-binding protein A
MNLQIRRLAVFGVVLVASLILATTYWQTWASAGLADRQDNAIQTVAEFSIERGEIRAGTTVLARNQERQLPDGTTVYTRRYPGGGPFSHAVGYSTQVRSRAGLERSLNDYLTGANANLNTVVETTLDRLRGSTITGNDVELTLRPQAQQAARQALGNRCGAIVALEPATGRILVLVSSPGYDPNLIETDFEGAQRAPTAECRPANALYNRATQGLYAPGSTFKILTAAAALEEGTIQADQTFDDPGYCVQYGRRVYNYFDQQLPTGYGRVDLTQAIQHSINSVFCNIGQQLRADRLIEYTKRFGFYARPPLETPTDERFASGLYQDGSLFDPDDPNEVDPGRFAFGQERLLVTPLQMAMVTAALGNGGVVMQPFLVEQIVSPGGRPVTTTEPQELGRAVSQRTAAVVTAGMVAAVAAGTSTAAQLPGMQVAGKTGTAETGTRGVNTTSFVAFAPANQPRVAIAVFLESQRGTGGTTAAPIARTVLQALLPGS